MRAIVLMFDTLNRLMLSSYGCGWTHTPNFQRLARKAVTFDRSYVCSMPCMPARRDYLTGRPNFLHRGWGPMEPFDDSMPQLLRAAGVYTHMATDHYHYFEAGGATYHTQFNSWEFFRGQEGDPWIGQVAPPSIPENRWPKLGADVVHGPRRQDWINRLHIRDECDFPQSRTIQAGVDFLRRNQATDNWLLHLETFDPHEPFFSHPQYKALYKDHFDNYKGPHADWPSYSKTTAVDPQVIEHIRFEYAALLSMCDAKLGQLLDTMDELDLWKDTMLVVWTDHGFLLGEHERFAKVWCPYFEEVAHTPFFIHDPRHPEQAGTRRDALVQPSIDLAPTLLEYFGVPVTADMTGHGLRPVIRSDAPVRDTAIFGHFGAQLNITDGRWFYRHSPARPDNQPLHEYTLMPTRMRTPFSTADLSADKISIAPPFSFTKNCALIRTPGKGFMQSDPEPSTLFDLQADPGQTTPVNDPATINRLLESARQIMRLIDAPPEQYARLGL